MITIKNSYAALQTPCEESYTFYLPQVLEMEYTYDDISQKKINLTYYEDVHCEFIYIVLSNIQCKVSIKNQVYQETCVSAKKALLFVETKIAHFEFLQRLNVCKNLELLLKQYGASYVYYDKRNAKELECVFANPIFTIFEEKEKSVAHYFSISCYITKTTILLRNKGMTISILDSNKSILDSNDVATIVQSFWLFTICEYKQIQFWDKIKNNYKHLIFNNN